MGFLTGSLLSGALVGVAVWAFYAPTSGNKFVENLPKRVPKRKAIIIQEELERKYVRFFSSKHGHIWLHESGFL